MVPQSFVAFFSASAGAGAALVGLLFVAVSIAPQHIVAVDAPIERQALAATTFTAMVNAFFISISALIPGGGLPIVGLVVSGTSIVSSLSLAWHLLRRQRGVLGVVRALFLVIVGLVLYGYEFYYSVGLLHNPHDIGAVFILSGVLVGIYGLGLARAWQLLGAQRFGFGGWFNVLRNLEDTDRTPGRPAADAPASVPATSEPPRRASEGTR